MNKIEKNTPISAAKTGKISVQLPHFFDFIHFFGFTPQKSTSMLTISREFDE